MSHYGDTAQFCECNTAVVNLKPALKVYECVDLAPLKPEMNTDEHEKGTMVGHARVFDNSVPSLTGDKRHTRAAPNALFP